MEYKVADPTFPGAANVVIDCANTAALALDLKSNFDFTAFGNRNLPDLVTRILSPKSDTLRVPSGGRSTFMASATSNGANGTIIVRPTYVRPFAEFDPDELYAVSICQLRRRNGPCMASPTFSVEYDTEKGVTQFFKIFVEAPASDPGFDPTMRRVFLQFKDERPPGFDGVSETTVAAESIAPKLN